MEIGLAALTVSSKLAIFDKFCRCDSQNLQISQVLTIVTGSSE